jgi:hypothetical protein
MTNKDMFDAGVFQFVVYVDNHATGKSKDGIDLFLFKNLDQNLSAGEFHNKSFLQIRKKKSVTGSGLVTD